MTVKDVAAMEGISVQSVYKRFKANGLKVESLKDKETGHFTPEGEAAVERIFKPKFKDFKPDLNEVERLTTEVERLKESLKQVETEVERLTTALDIVREERDYLREQVKAAQVLQLEAIKKIPAALPEGEKRFRFPWFKKRQ